MNVRLLAMLAVFAVLGAAGLGVRTLFVGAEQPTPLPHVPARHAPTPGPTPIPLAAPEEASLITADKARDAFIKLYAKMYGTALDVDSVTVRRVTAGDLGAEGLPFHAADYPVWLVSATGTFYPRSVPAGVSQMDLELSKMTAQIDAADGSLLGVTLTGLRQPAE